MLLNISDACTIADIIRAVQSNAPVAKLLDGGEVVGGTFRSIVKGTGGGMLGSDDDVRDGYVWVTMQSGFEQWWPMTEVIELVKTGEIALNYKV